MGRGRQKAKHTKIARDLKYFSPDTNYNALEAEIGSHTSEAHAGWSEEDFAEEDSHRCPASERLPRFDGWGVLGRAP